MLEALLFAAAAVAPVREIRVVMGTTAEVWVSGLEAPAPALGAAFEALDRVDRQMSLWKESDLARLNREGDAEVPPELLRVLQHALDVAAASGGAFDPTVEPLVRASGGLGGPRRALGDDERKKLLARVGASRVRVDPASRRVRLAPGTRIDLGGIAKGYAVDLALEALRRAGARSGLVNLGGSSLGVFGEPLTLDVRNPVTPGGRPWAIFRVEGRVVATSGGDEKPDHVFDPRTGRPARSVLAATVVAATGLEADALSTAVYVLGADAGLALLAARGADGIVLLRKGPRGILRTTPDFAERYGLEAAPGTRVEEP